MMHKLLQTFRLTILFILTSFSFSALFAQERKFKSNEMVDIGSGQTYKIISTKGDGNNAECKIAYYVNNKKVGNPFWLPASKVAEQERRAQTNTQTTPAKKVDTSLPVTKNKGVPNKQDRQAVQLERPAVKDQKDAKPKFVPFGRDVKPRPVKKRGEVQKVDETRPDTSKKIDGVQPVEESRSDKSKKTGDDSKNVSAEKKNSNNAVVNVFQSPTSITPATTVNERRVKKLSVIINCSNSSCDLDYIKTQITLVDYFLDQQAADVNVLITEQKNGGGGSTIQMIFYGQHNFTRSKDTLLYDLSPNATPYESREQMANYLKLGLIPFLSKSASAKDVFIKLEAPKETATVKTTSSKDAWNYWVFRIGSEGTFDAEQVYKSFRVSGYVTANRITDKLKINFSGSSNYNNYKYSYHDTYTDIEYEIKNRDYLFSHSLIVSLGKHWGAGYQAGVSQSTFSNNKNSIYGRTAVEYSIFPYKDVTTRFITVSYGVDVRSNRYYDTTIFFKNQELLFGQSARAQLSFNQKWGTFSSTLAYSSFFKDPSLNNFSADVNFNINITGGLSFYMYTSAARIHDQVYLVKGAASVQDVLTRRRQLASDYSLSSGAGLSFRFGSKLNNFVNPRMNKM